jgi:hypothetical protein
LLQSVLSLVTASFTALRLIHKATLRVKLLLTGCENKFGAAFFAD